MTWPCTPWPPRPCGAPRPIVLVFTERAMTVTFALHRLMWKDESLSWSCCPLDGSHMGGSREKTLLRTGSAQLKQR